MELFQGAELCLCALHYIYSAHLHGTLIRDYSASTWRENKGPGG